MAHGAKGMIYNYGPIGNPNNAYREGFIYHHVGPAVVADVFAGTGRTYADVMAAIRKELKPRSFATGKTMAMKNITDHHPDGVGFNVIGVIPGTDPQLKDEVIMLAGHLDHLGLHVGAAARGQRQRHGRRRRAGRRRGHGQVARSSPSGPSSSTSSARRNRGWRDRSITSSTRSIPLDKTLVLINMEGTGRGDDDLRFRRAHLSGLLVVHREGQRKVHPSPVWAGAGPPIRAARGRIRPGSSGPGCPR